MNSQHLNLRRFRRLPARREWWAAPAAFLATLLALPVNAGIVIPDDPLTSTSRVAPNILFILDDSGSMAWQYMYVTNIANITGGGINSGPTGINSGSNSQDNDHGSDSTSDNAIYDQTYVTNTLYYNPAVNYQPWMQANGNRATGGTSYTSAYSSDNYITSTAAATTSGTVNLGGSLSPLVPVTRTFYVPKDTANTAVAYLSNALNYYRYQILGGGTDVVQSERGNVALTSAAGPSWTGLSGTTGMQNLNTFNVPAGTARIEVVSSGGTHGTNNPNYNNGSGNGADLYLQYNAAPTTLINRCAQTGGDNSGTCTINNPEAGNWRFGLNAASRYAGVAVTVTLYTTNSCNGSLSGNNTWINCVSQRPLIPDGDGGTTRRTVDAEKANFAAWYSYYRTRIKAAKGGASDAFRPLGLQHRVGYRTIWNRSNFDIPVSDGNDGRFVNTNSGVTTNSRLTWYNRLYGATASNGTPLRAALESAGEYYSSTAPSGPYGPQANGNQYTCRQNFTILTTDGYWNSDSVSVGNADNTSGTTYNNGKPATDPNYRTGGYVASAPYQDGFGNTLADVAMYYWKRDLRTEAQMTNNVPTSTKDPAFWQHMVTFGLSIGLSGNKGWGRVEDVPANATWSSPLDVEDADRIDDLLHAAVNGRGTFVSAASPTEFTEGLSQALAAIDQRASSFSSVATNSASLRTGAMVFSASYVSGIWTGDVKGYAISSSGGVLATPAWSASFPTPWSMRKVYTLGGTFPTAAQVTALDRSSVGPVDFPATGLQNANYIKGDSSREERNNIGLLRNRTSLLGDIIGSSPEYVADTNTLYIGANDGMLHAFNAATGVEQFAYVPGMLDMTRLRDLSRGDYVHRYFVDGPLVASPRTLTPGRNILVGSLGRGGRGLYALDVSNPSTITSTPALWEKTSASTGFANLGLVMNKPIIANVKTGATTRATAVVLGNGVNSANDRAVLIVANLVTGDRIAEIDTNTGDATTPNGLFAPTGVLGPDGKSLAYVYAGDMLGNVWKFDLTDASSANWTATRLFTARANGGAGAVQPITGGIAVATDPRTLKRWLFFGTGRLLTAADAADTTANGQGMYGIVDDGSAVAYTDLTARGLTGTGTTRSFDTEGTLPATRRGWYVNLPGAGERIVQDAQVESNVLVTASLIPTGNTCEDANGTGYINAVDAFTGTSLGSSYFDLDGDGTTTDELVNGNPVGSVNYNVGMPTLPILFPGRIVVGGTGGSSGGADDGAGGGRKFGNTWNRVTWREIRQD